MATFHHVLMATDLGDASDAAGRVAVSLAREQNATLTFVHVYPLPAVVYGVYPIYMQVQPSDQLQRAAEGALSDWARRMQAPSEARSVTLAGDPASAVLDEVKAQQADLLVVGTHGRRGLTHALLGSTAEKLLRLSPIPVLAVRAEKGP